MRVELLVSKWSSLWLYKRWSLWNVGNASSVVAVMAVMVVDGVERLLKSV